MAPKRGLFLPLQAGKCIDIVSVSVCVCKGKEVPDREGSRLVKIRINTLEYLQITKFLLNIDDNYRSQTCLAY